MNKNVDSTKQHKQNSSDNYNVEFDYCRTDRAENLYKKKLESIDKRTYYIMRRDANTITQKGTGTANLKLLQVTIKSVYY